VALGDDQRGGDQRSGLEKRRRKSGWCVSEPSAKAMNADVSTYASNLLAIHHVVDVLARMRIPRLDHARVAHPGPAVIHRHHAPQRAAEEFRERDTQALGLSLRGDVFVSVRLI